MGDDSNETATANTAAERAAKRGTQSSPDSVPEAVRYSIADLKENSRGLLDCSPHAVEGAFHDVDQKTFTLADAEKRVNAFLKRREEKSDVEGDS